MPESLIFLNELLFGPSKLELFWENVLFFLKKLPERNRFLSVIQANMPLAFMLTRVELVPYHRMPQVAYLCIFPCFPTDLGENISSS